MKVLVLAIALAASSTALASQIVIDGLKAQYKLQTTGEITHTEYRQEQRDSTCSRDVPNGSHQECRNVPGDQICHEVGGGQQCRQVGGGQECHQVGGGQECGLTPSGQQCHELPGHEECYQVPGHEECYQTPGHQECYQTPGHQECRQVQDYRRETYACRETVNVPYVVKDSDIENEVTVNVDINRNLPAGVRETIDLVQTGAALTLSSVTSTGKVLVSAVKTESVVSDNGRIKKIQTVITVKLIDRAALNAFSHLSEITADGNGMKITMGQITDVSAVRFDVLISRKKFLGRDETVLQRSIAASEVTLTNSGGQTVVNFDFDKLGIKDKVQAKKIHIVIQTQSTLNLDNVVNRRDIPTSIGAKKELETRL